MPLRYFLVAFFNQHYLGFTTFSCNIFMQWNNSGLSNIFMSLFQANEIVSWRYDIFLSLFQATKNFLVFITFSCHFFKQRNNSWPSSIFMSLFKQWHSFLTILSCFFFFFFFFFNVSWNKFLKMLFIHYKFIFKRENVILCHTND